MGVRLGSSKQSWQPINLWFVPAVSQSEYLSTETAAKPASCWLHPLTLMLESKPSVSHSAQAVVAI